MTMIVNVREDGCLTKNAYLRFPSAGAAKECIARANDVGIIAKNVRLGVRMATAEEHLTWANREVKGNSVTPNTAASNVVMGEHVRIVMLSLLASHYTLLDLGPTRSGSSANGGTRRRVYIAYRRYRGERRKRSDRFTVGRRAGHWT